MSNKRRNQKEEHSLKGRKYIDQALKEKIHGYLQEQYDHIFTNKFKMEKTHIIEELNKICLQYCEKVTSSVLIKKIVEIS